MYRRDFHSLVDTGKNCYYRMMSRETMDWRTSLLRMCVRFFAIVLTITKQWGLCLKSKENP